MAGPTSKPADMYNYESIAYIETNPNVIRLLQDEEKLVSNVVPRPIPKGLSYLNVEVSFDATISGREIELFCECKYSVTPRILHINSKEVKESLLEFIAAEKYRYSVMKKDGIFYLLVSNCPLTSLEREIESLKQASDDILSTYIRSLRRRARMKWSILRSQPEIKVEWLRSVLQRMDSIQIERVTLARAGTDPNYLAVFDRLLGQVKKADPSRLPLKYREDRTVRLILASEGDLFLKTINGYLVEIDERILTEVVSGAENLRKDFSIVPLGDLSLDGVIKLVNPNDMSEEDAMSMIVRAANDHLYSKGSRILVVVTPGSFYLYFFSMDWIYEIITSPNARTPNGLHKLSEVQNRTGPLSNFVLARIVSETIRLRAGRDARDDVMDFSDVGESP